MRKDKKSTAEYHREWYAKGDNKVNVLAGNKARRKQTRQYLNETKHMKPCLDCGVAYPSYVMDYDHRDSNEKFMSVCDMATRGFGKAKIDEEISKCDLVCANCHRERTHGKD